jgi:hypothetical protein
MVCYEIRNYGIHFSRSDRKMVALNMQVHGGLERQHWIAQAGNLHGAKRQSETTSKGKIHWEKP